jgi:hypothetical protein
LNRRLRRLRRRDNGLLHAFGALGGLLFGYDAGVLLFIKREFHLTPWLEGWVVSALLSAAILGPHLRIAFGSAQPSAATDIPLCLGILGVCSAYEAELIGDE